MMEKKSIKQGQGFRITSRGPWANDSETLIVHLPTRRRPNFHVSRVKSVGIVGQPQLTFDNKEDAERYLNSYPLVAEQMSVGWTNKEYMCYKIPITCGDGTTMDAWLPVSNFPEIGSEKWQELVDMFPEYFTTDEQINNIDESLIGRELNEEDVREIMSDTSLSEEQKAKKLFNRDLKWVYFCGSLPYALLRDRDWEELQEWLKERLPEESEEREHQLLQDLRDLNDDLGVSPWTYFCGNSFSGDPYELYKGYEVYVLNDSESARRWWKYITGCIELTEQCYGKTSFETKRGFFEDYNNERINAEEIKEIALSDELTDDEKCMKLWGRPYDRVIKGANSLLYVANRYDDRFVLPEYPEGKTSQDLYNVLMPINRKYNNPGGYSVMWMTNDLNVKDAFNEYARYTKPVKWRNYIGELIDAYEEFFGIPETKRGFFEAYEEKNYEVHETWKIKTPGSYCYRIKVNFPNTRRNTFRWSIVRCNPYGSGPAWQELCFLNKEDAERFIETYHLPDYPNGWNQEPGKWYAYSARVPVTLIKFPFEDGYEGYIRKEALPREDKDDSTRRWWNDVRTHYPEYFGEPVRGFFTESVNTNFSGEEVDDIMGSDISEEEKCRKLFQRDLDWVLFCGRLRYMLQYIHEFSEEDKEQLETLMGDRDSNDVLQVMADFVNSSHAVVKSYLIYNNANSPFNLTESYRYYVKGQPLPERSIARRTYNLTSPDVWYNVLKGSIEKCEEIFNKVEVKKGFFESREITEDYRHSQEDIKRTVIKYVMENGYIKPEWNGRYSTPSPTVEMLNRIIRDNQDLSEFMCAMEEYNQFSNWLDGYRPQGPEGVIDWYNKCVNTWEKENSYNKDDIKNLCSLVSYRKKSQRIQQEIRDREDRRREHEEHVNSDKNTWAGEVGDKISFEVAEAKIFTWVHPSSYYASEYPVWKIIDTQGRTYTWGDTKAEAQIKPGNAITAKIKALREFRDIKETQIWKVEIFEENRKLGFFEDLDPEDMTEAEKWLMDNYGITLEQLKEFTDINFDCRWDDRYNVDDDEFCVTWEPGGTGIISPFYDDCGWENFETLERVFEYYGEEFAKNWIDGFMRWMKTHGIYNYTPRAKKGFFN